MSFFEKEDKVWALFKLPAFGRDWRQHKKKKKNFITIVYLIFCFG